MKELKDSPTLDGTVLSENLSPVGKQIAVYLQYAGKIARVASEQMTMSKTEKPAGLEIFLKAIEDEEKRRLRKLKPDEKKALEKSTRFAIQPVKIGNSTHMFNAVFHELISENKDWQKLIDFAKKDIQNISKQTGAIEKLQNYDDRDGL